jgi:Flp pilus assembly protein TadD
MLALGDTRESERQFLEAIRVYRDSATGEDPKIDYGAFLVRQGRSEEALDSLEKAVKASPKSVRANMELGKALLHLGKLKPAVVHLEKAVALAPNAWAARLLLGKAYLQLGRTADGEREMQLGQQGWAKQNERPLSTK